MWRCGLWAAMAAACFLSACASNEAEPSEVTLSAPTPATTSTTTAPAAGETAASKLPLYGIYLRDVPGVDEQPPSAPSVEDEWALDFQEGVEEWSGVLELYYLGRRGGTTWGRAYEYSSDRETLHLGGVIRPKDIALRLGGFECRADGPAEYTWWRSDDNRILRLKATTEPCEVRRAILEGEWRFYD
jgi:hypothetical protein